MLDNLLEIEVAYSLLKNKGEDEKEKDPIDVNYEKLNTKLEVIWLLDAQFFISIECNL